MQGHPDVQIKVGDKVYTARFSVKAWAALHDYYKITSIQDLVKRFTDPAVAGVKDVIAGIWGSLRTHHPEITIEEVENILDEIGLQESQRILAESLNKSVLRTNGDLQGKEVVASYPPIPQP